MKCTARGSGGLPAPPWVCLLLTSVQNSLTFSKIMLQCLSKAFTRPSSFLLFLQLIKTWELVFTLVVRTDRGPVRNISSSRFSRSSIDICVGPLACKQCKR